MKREPTVDVRRHIPKDERKNAAETFRRCHVQRRRKKNFPIN